MCPQCRECLLAPDDQKDWTQLLEAAWSGVTPAKRRAELTGCRAEPVYLSAEGAWDTG